MKYFYVTMLGLLFTVSFGYSQLTDIPNLSGASELVTLRTGFDYDGDNGVEIIVQMVSGADFYTGIFSQKKNAYIYTSLASDKTHVVISGDYNGDGRMDVAVDKKVICFP